MSKISYARALAISRYSRKKKKKSNDYKKKRKGVKQNSIVRIRYKENYFHLRYEIRKIHCVYQKADVN